MTSLVARSKIDQMSDQVQDMSITPFQLLLSREPARGCGSDRRQPLKMGVERPLVCSTLQLIRASLLASAVANLLRCMRGAACFSQGPKLNRSQL